MMFKVEIYRDGHWEVVAIFDDRELANEFADNFDNSNVGDIVLNPTQEDLILAVSRFEIKMDKWGNEQSCSRDDDEFDDVQAENFFDKFDIKDNVITALVRAPTRKAAIKKVHDFRINAIGIGIL